jgi:hypothetical protein
VRHLNLFDVAAIAVSWTGACVTAWLSQTPVVAGIAVIAAYYLSKWVIVRLED